MVMSQVSDGPQLFLHLLNIKDCLLTKETFGTALRY